MARRLSVVLLSTALMLPVRSSSAQVNAEALRSTLRDNPTFLFLDASLVGHAGNTQTMAVSGALFGAVTKAPHLFFAKASADYGEASSETNISRWLVHARYNYDLNQSVAVEALAQGQHDSFRRLTVRDLYGAGFRFNVHEEEELDVFCGTTYLFEHEVLNAVEGSPSSSDTFHRSSNYIGLNARISDRVVASSVAYFQPRFDRPKDFRVLSESYITVTITKRLAASVSASLWYDNEPPFGVKTYDVEVKNSLSLKFF